MAEKVLNITNGDYFNEYFLSKFGGIAVPFCEAMMDGECVADIYSDEFIKLRTQALNVDESEYREKMYAYDILNKEAFDAICLWFGKDTFCQMNLLTLLAYLEQIGYSGDVILNYIDDEAFEVVKSDIEIRLGAYKRIYNEIFISKIIPDNVGALSQRAIELYFDYHSDNGALVNLARANSDKSKMELIVLLLEKSKDYGLSDLQAEKIIDSLK